MLWVHASKLHWLFLVVCTRAFNWFNYIIPNDSSSKMKYLLILTAYMIFPTSDDLKQNEWRFCVRNRTVFIALYWPFPLWVYKYQPQASVCAHPFSSWSHPIFSTTIPLGLNTLEWFQALLNGVIPLPGMYLILEFSCSWECLMLTSHTMSLAQTTTP